MAKSKDVADRLRATVLRPYYPASGLFRVIRDDDGLQVDFMTSIHGVRSFEGRRDRASPMDIEGHPCSWRRWMTLFGAKRQRSGRATSP